MYRIYWESSIKKSNGCLMTYSNAKEYVKLLNKKYPDIKHWIKEEK